MLPLSAAFKREAAKATSAPVVLVQIANYTGGKFVWASRKVLGFPNSVSNVDSRSSELDPLECSQSLSTITVEFVDDLLIRKFINDNALVGKTITLKVGFDTGDDATFLEADYAGFAGGIIDGYTIETGKVIVTAKDPRSLIWERAGGVSRTIPNNEDGGAQPAPFGVKGAATTAILTLLQEAGVPAALYDAASFAPAAHTGSGHLVVMRDYYGASSDRRISEPTPVSELVNEIANVLRAYVLVREDGLVALKSFHASAATVDRFVETDLIAGSVKCGIEFGSIVTSAYMRSMWQGMANGNAGGFRFIYRDDEADAQIEWGTESGDPRAADWSTHDKWFCDSLGNWSNSVIAVGAATIHVSNPNFAGNTALATAPLGVDASRPGYLFIVGPLNATGGTDNGEVVKYTTVAAHAVNGYTHYDLGGLTHAQFGTVDEGHGIGGAGTQLVWDVTAPVYACDKVLQRFSEGAPTLEFDTPLHKYAVQLGDLVNVETPLFVRKGLDGLAVGNVTKFEVVGKDVNIEEGRISWKVVEVRTNARTPVGGLGADRFGGWINSGLGHADWLTFVNPFRTDGFFSGTAGALVRNWLSGAVPSVPSPASLTAIIPEQQLPTGLGVVSAPRTSFLFTASKDTYCDFNPQDSSGGHWEFQDVANGAGAPAVSTGFVRAFKVVTNVTQVTSVTDLRSVALVGTPNVVDAAITTAKVNDLAITTPKIGALAITEPKIANDAVINRIIAVNAVENDNIALGHVDGRSLSSTKLGRLWVNWKTIVFTFTAPVRDVSNGETEWAGVIVHEDGVSFTITDSGSTGTANRFLWIDLDVSTSVMQTGNALPAPGPRRIVLAGANGNMLSTETDLATALRQFRISGANGDEIYLGEPTFGIAAKGARVTRNGVESVGSDANIDLYLIGKGTGRAKIGRDKDTLLSILGAGTSFPLTPATDDLFYREDLDILFYYDGTRWLSVHVETMTMLPWQAHQNTAYSATTVNLYRSAVPEGPGDIWLLDWTSDVFIGATNDNTPNDWWFDLLTQGGTVIANYRTGTPDLPAGWNRKVVTIRSATARRTPATDKYFTIDATKFGAPSNIQIVGGCVRYRHVG